MTVRLEMQPHRSQLPFQREDVSRMGSRRQEIGTQEMIPSHVLSSARALDRVIADRHRRMQLSPGQQLEENPDQPIMLQYDGNFDLQLYDQAYAIEDETLRQRRLETLDGYIRTQLRTHLGERLNVLLSSITYYIDADGEMYEPTLGKVVAMVAQGANHQLEQGANEIDIPRLLADTPEMVAIQQALCDRETPIGTMMIALSPPGGQNQQSGQESQFLHNFVDIFRLEEIDGKRVIKLYRYASTLTYEEDLHRLVQIKQDYLQSAEEGEDLVSFFLRHPLAVSDQFNDPEEVHRFFRSEDQFMTTAIFEGVILPGCRELIERYIHVLHAYAGRKLSDEQRESMVQLQHATFNMLLIKTDELVDQWEKLQQSHARGLLSAEQFAMSQDALIMQAVSQIALLSNHEIMRDGKQENVRQAAGDCPGKSGMATNPSDISSLAERPTIAMNTSPFNNTAELESDEYGSTHFTCTKGHPNTRPLHAKISECTTCREPFTC